MEYNYNKSMIKTLTEEADYLLLDIEYMNKEKDKLEDKTVDRLQEKYHCFVAVSFVCFALEWLL